MSIFATFLHFDDDEGPAPIVYRGSHILPSDADERGGLVMLALIPSFINRTGDDGPEDEAPLPWLRLSVAARIVTEEDAQPGEMVGTAPAMQDVILDASQVRRMRDALTAWFYPPGQAPSPPTRSEVIAALTHDHWCNRVLHPELDQCDCPVAEVLNGLVEHGWLQLAEGAGDG